MQEKSLMSGTTDETLYNRFLANGDEGAFRILFERHRDSLILFLNSYVGNLDDAEELMLDAFAVTAAGKSIFSGKSSFRTWLFSIGKKLALMRIRRSRYKEVPLDDNLEDKQGPVDLHILQEERNRQIYQALSNINPEYRQILILIYFEQMSHEEAGRVMGKNKKQIYNLIERGKKALKAELEK